MTGKPENVIMPLRERLARREEITRAAMIAREKFMAFPAEDTDVKGQIHPETAAAEAPHEERSTGSLDDESQSSTDFDDDFEESPSARACEEKPSSGAAPVGSNSFGSKSTDGKTSGGSMKSRVAAAGRFARTYVSSKLAATRKVLPTLRRRSPQSLQQMHPEMYQLALERTRRAHASAMASRRGSSAVVPDFQPIAPTLPKHAWRPEGRSFNIPRRGSQPLGTASLYDVAPEVGMQP
mmetsp:Transcript_3458/g.7989  ORF Transcript_3458/g.7989 Transcript_3458/m.7989 type:complete len:238 (+) Transcript_3458:3-716(+)